MTTLGPGLRAVGTVAIVAVLVAVLDLAGSASQAMAAGTVASDSFNRTVANGWGAADQGGNWTVLDTPANWSVTPGVGSIVASPNTERRAVLGSASAKNVDLLAKIAMPRCTGSSTNCIGYVLGRVSGGSSPSYYRVGLLQAQNRSTVFIRAQRNDGSNVASDLDTGIPAADGTVVWIRVEFEGANPTKVRARAWRDGTMEPSSWLLNTTDSTAAEQATAGIGVRARNEDTGASHTFRYESFLATEVAGAPVKPSVKTEPASPVATTTATLNGQVNPNGSEVTECIFEYGPTPSYGASAPCTPAPGAGVGNVAVSAAISSLNENSTYHFRIVAKDVGGTSEGADAEFITGSSTPFKPTVKTEPASPVATTTATLNGQVNPNGSEVTECIFEYGPTPSYGASAPCTPAPGAGVGNVAVSAAISSLNENSTYHFRIVAKDVGGTSEGADAEFKTTVAVANPAEDNFNRSVASGWGSAEMGGWWTVVGSPWNWSVAPGAGTVTVGANGEERAYLSSFTVGDTDVLERATLPRCAGGSNCISFVLGRYTAAYAPTYYRVGLLQTAAKPDIFIRAQRSDGSSLAGDIDTGLAAANGASVNLRVEFIGANPTTVRARAWLAGTPEPTTWRLSVTDSTAAEQTGGMVGLRLRNEDTASHAFAVQSFQASGAATPVSVTPNPTGQAHLLFVVVDGTVYVYDIDNGHKLVNQFPIPEAGKRGLMVDPARGVLYITECGSSPCNGSHGSMLAYDLVHNVVAWIANYAFGVDQSAIMPDGSRIYMPHGLDATDGVWSILDTSSGKPIGSIASGTNDGGHNTIAALDGSAVYLTGHNGTTANYIHVLNPATNQVVQEVGPAREGIGPYTINGMHTLAFTTSIGEHCGFQVLSLTSGSVLYTVPFSGACKWVTGDPDHGISLSPDETRLYVVDAPLDQLKVYDVSGLPGTAPTPVASIQLSPISGNESPCQSFCEREGWVLNDLSGRYVYIADSGNVVDTQTNSVVATLPPLANTREPIEIDWANGAPTATSTRFGLGRVTH